MSKTPAMDALLAWLAAEAGDPSDNPYGGLDSLIGDVLNAPDMAAALRKQLPQSASDFTGVPMLVEWYRIEHSSIADGKGAPFYVAMTVQMGDPAEQRIITTSSWKILAQIAKAANDGGFPFLATIEETRVARKGENAPLALVAYEPPTD